MREELEAQRAELQAKLSEVEDERRDIIAAARRNMQGEMEEFRRELRRLRNDMRDASLPLENLRAVQQSAEGLDKALQQPVENGVKAPDDLLDWTPRLGDAVWLEALKAEGTIIELDKDEAMVQIGSLKIRADLRDLKKPTRAERKVEQAPPRHRLRTRARTDHPQRAVAGAGTRSARGARRGSAGTAGQLHRRGVSVRHPLRADHSRQGDGRAAPRGAGSRPRAPADLEVDGRAAQRRRRRRDDHLPRADGVDAIQGLFLEYPSLKRNLQAVIDDRVIVRRRDDRQARAVAQRVQRDLKLLRRLTRSSGGRRAFARTANGWSDTTRRAAARRQPRSASHLHQAGGA